jgi:DNA invertase Pin-like site-specific DNA recombinase
MTATDLETALSEALHGPKIVRAALYLRVSTDGQTTENQRQALARVAAERGWQVVATYEDRAISGAKSRQERPGLDAALKAAKRYDVLMSWSLDRLGRSLIGLLDTLAELDRAGVALFLEQQRIDTTTPAGRMFFQVIGAFAEFERSMIRSRVMAGLERANAEGRFGGRPKSLDDATVSNVRALVVAGATVSNIRAALGVGASTVTRVRKEMVA